MTPQQRDRWMQVFLAQARGPARNGDLLRQSVDRALKINAARQNRIGMACMEDALIETLSQVVDALEALGVVYAVTGSVASAVHGEPYSSMDDDLIVLATANDAARLSSRLTPRFYAPEDMLMDAVTQHSFVNVVDNRTGFKIDLSFVGDDAFLLAVLRRRVRACIGTHAKEFWFVTPEDVILMKLVWRKDTRSTKQWENALSVARIKGTRMDWEYLFQRAKDLGVENDLNQLRDEAGI